MFKKVRVRTGVMFISINIRVERVGRVKCDIEVISQYFVVFCI